MSEYLPYGGLKWLKNIDEFDAMSNSMMNLMMNLMRI